MATVTDILRLANSCGVSLRIQGECLVASPGSDVTPELGAALRDNKPALMAWPGIEDRRCVCGAEPWLFRPDGVAVCGRWAYWSDAVPTWAHPDPLQARSR